MCFTIPKKIIKIEDAKATLETSEEVDITELKGCQVGDYVIISGSLAIEKVSTEDALKIRTLIKSNI